MLIVTNVFIIGSLPEPHGRGLIKPMFLALLHVFTAHLSPGSKFQGLPWCTLW
jgi:hypothetical protein